jgi:hypothetical protein
MINEVLVKETVFYYMLDEIGAFVWCTCACVHERKREREKAH